HGRGVHQRLVHEQRELLGDLLAFQCGGVESHAEAGTAVAAYRGAFEAAEAVDIEDDLRAGFGRVFAVERSAAGRQVGDVARHFVGGRGKEQPARQVDAHAAEAATLRLGLRQDGILGPLQLGLPHGPPLQPLKSTAVSPSSVNRRLPPGRPGEDNSPFPPGPRLTLGRAHGIAVFRPRPAVSRQSVRGDSCSALFVPLTGSPPSLSSRLHFPAASAPPRSTGFRPPAPPARPSRRSCSGIIPSSPIPSATSRTPNPSTRRASRRSSTPAPTADRWPRPLPPRR